MLTPRVRSGTWGWGWVGREGQEDSSLLPSSASAHQTLFCSCTFYLTAALHQQMLFASTPPFIGFESCKSPPFTAISGIPEQGASERVKTYSLVGQEKTTSKKYKKKTTTCKQAARHNTDFIRARIHCLWVSTHTVNVWEYAEIWTR